MALQFKAVDMANFLSLHAKLKANLQKIRGLLQKELYERFDETIKAGDDLEKELSAGGASSKEVDRLLDRAWAGLFRNLESWEHGLTESPSLPLSEQEERLRVLARGIRRGLVGEDLRFLQLSHHNEWRESQKRLVRLTTKFDETQTYRDALDVFGLG